MRVCHIAAAVLIGAASAAVSAQSLAPPEQQAAMRKLDFLVGNWQGSGWMEYVRAKPRTFHGAEVVQSKLEGLVLVIDGVYRGQLAGEGPETVVHGVYGLIYFDTATGRYRFNGFTARGVPINTTAEVSERRVTWSNKVPHLGEVRYTIWIDEEDHWIQTGEIIERGQERPFLELNLERVKQPQPPSREASDLRSP